MAKDQRRKHMTREQQRDRKLARLRRTDEIVRRRTAFFNRCYGFWATTEQDYEKMAMDFLRSKGRLRKWHFTGRGKRYWMDYRWYKTKGWRKAMAKVRKDAMGVW